MSALSEASNACQSLTVDRVAAFDESEISAAPLNAANKSMIWYQPDALGTVGSTTPGNWGELLDLALMGAHYTLTCEDPGWDERTDINDDSIVNILGLSCAWSNFLKVSTTP